MGLALSPDGRCKTFDESANGFTRADGAGAIVLELASDAQKAMEEATRVDPEGSVGSKVSIDPGSVSTG